MSDKKLSDDAPKSGSTPNANSARGGIDPSAPSTGTAGWGNTADEKRERVIQRNSEASSPNAQGAGDVRHTSYPQNEAAQNPAAREGARPRGDRSLRCAETLGKECGWSITGSDEEEILGYMRVHAREAHGKNEFTSAELANVRRAIHKQAA